MVHREDSPDASHCMKVASIWHGAVLRLIVLSTALVLCLFAGACSSREINAPAPEEVTATRDHFERHLASRVFTETSDPYLGGRLVTRRSDNLDTPLMRTSVTLRQRGSLSELAASVAKLAPVSALVAEPDAGTDKTADDLDILLSSPSGRVLDVNYQGPLRGLLDTIAGLSGCGWDYDEATSRVTFSTMQVRTFVLAALTGTVSWESQVSNRTAEKRSGNLSGTSINATVSSGDTSNQTAQVNTSHTSLDIWKDVENAVRALLSRLGSVSVNQAAGTITVRDSYDRLRQIERCINEINARLERQIALRVRVWALEVSDERDAGLDLQAIFTSPDVRVVAGATALDSENMASVSILKGRLSDSSGVLRGLMEQGRATQLTSASGLALNNQPFPVQAIRRHAYLAGMTMSTTEYSQTSEITPGEVTTGFAMTIIPHILPDSHVLLQYNVTLSTLEEMATIERDTVYVQLPQVATRAFSQRTRLKTGQTLVLAGFEQDTAQAASNLGLLSLGRAVSAGKTLLLITIELEGADNV